MSENNDRKEESDAGEQTGSPDRDDPKNFGDDSQKASAPEVDTDSAEYPSAPGADESPQEPITEESSPSGGPEKKPGGPDADESGKTTGSPYVGKEATRPGESAEGESAEGESAEDHPSTPGEGTNEDNLEQDGGDQNEDSA